MKETYSSGTVWESRVAYSRALKINDMIFVSGTTATNDKGKITSDTAYMQTTQCISNINTALQALGTDLNKVVQTRMYVTDIDQWQEYGRAHGEAFASINPVTTMVEVARLIDPKMLIEMEAIAIPAKD